MRLAHSIAIFILNLGLLNLQYQFAEARPHAPATDTGLSMALTKSPQTPKKQQPRSIRYHITWLSRHVPDDGNKIAINSYGVVLAGLDVYRHGHRLRLKVPPTDDGHVPDVHAYGIDDRGDILGDKLTAVDGAITSWIGDVFLWHHGHFKTISSSDVSAAAITKQGGIAFYVFPGPMDHDEDNEAYLWTHGKTIDLGKGTPVCMNDKGQVVIITRDRESFIWSHGMRSRCKLPAVPNDSDLSNAVSFHCINDHGQIAGSLRSGTDHQGQTVGTWHAFVWQNGNTMLLPMIERTGSDAFGINNNGQVIGRLDTNTGKSYAFLYERGVMYDLNSLIPRRSGWVLESAHAINDRGQIVCTGNKGLCLLTPVR